jgi:hypothetical protein
MSKGVQQDSLIFDDDEEETCPLCVEEFDLTDKGFKPCPCGYQVGPPRSPLRTRATTLTSSPRSVSSAIIMSRTT